MSVSEGTGARSSTYKVTITGDGVDIAKEIDAEAATEILALVMGGSGPRSRRRGSDSKRSVSRRTKPATGMTDKAAKPKARRKASGPAIVRDLSMRPSGKKSFADYVAEKQPKTHQQKQIVIVAWLRDQAGLSGGITIDHVNTCYIEASWPRPANLANGLQVTAVVKGWLDTSNMSDIKLTTRGEDEIEHGLPPESKKK
jgi:hypothetical protein